MLSVNRTKRKIQRGEPVYGLFCSNPSPLTVEMIGSAGYDFLIIDMEHILINPETVQHMIRAAEVFQLTPLVRVPEKSPGTILQVLDAGAQGVVIPHVKRGYPTGHLRRLLYPQRKSKLKWGKKCPVWPAGPPCLYGKGQPGSDVYPHD